MLFGVVALALCACTDSAPKADKRLVAAFVEMRVAEQLYGGESPMGRLVRRDVLKKYGYTRTPAKILSRLAMKFSMTENVGWCSRRLFRIE